MTIDTTALDILFDANPDTAEGIAGAYQLLLGGVPTQTGFTFLINNAVETNFGAGPGPVFNAESILINLANSLVRGNASAAANFATISAGTTLTDMVTSLYSAIIPEADRTAEGLAFVTRPEALQFYQNAADERGVAGDQGAAIVALASLLHIAVRDDVGVGADVNDLIAAVNDGSSQLPATGETLIDIDVADGTNFDPIVMEPTPDPTPTPTPPAVTTFTANINAFDTGNPAHSNEGITASGADNTINATVAQIAGATIDALGGTDTLNISGAGLADLLGVAALDTIDTLRLLDAGASLQIGSARDSDDFGALIGAGANDLIVAAGGNTNLASFEGFDMVDATGLADDDVLTIADTATGTNYTVNLGDSDLAAGASTSTDSITVVQDTPGATQSIVTGAGNDDITATGATVLTLDAGAGNDTVTLGDSVTNADVIVGGDGVDTLNISDGATSPEFSPNMLDKVSEFEIINILANSNISGHFISLKDSSFNTSPEVNITSSVSFTFHASDLTNNNIKLNASSSTIGLGIRGSQLDDILVLGSGNDNVFATNGSDIISFGSGEDTYLTNRLGENIFSSGVKTITDFVSGNSASNDRISFNLDRTASITDSNGINSMDNSNRGGVVILQNAQTTTELTTLISQDAMGNPVSVTNAVIAVFNSTTGQAEFWFDTNWNDAANRQHFLTLENIDLVGVQNFSTKNGVDFSVG